MLLDHPRRSASSLACNASSSDIVPPVEEELPVGADATWDSPRATGCLFKAEADIASPVGASVS